MNNAKFKKRGKQQKGKDQRSLQENWRCQRNISSKYGHNKGLNSRRDDKKAQKNCTKKYLNDMENHDGMVTHPEPDILECEVKWALGSPAVNKASGGDGIPAELFKRLCY